MFWAFASKNDAVELLSLGSECGVTEDRLLPPMFKATVENLDSSISPRSTSIARSSRFSSGFTLSTGLGVGVDGVSRSPKGVTEDVDVNPDASASLGVRDNVSRVMSNSSESVSTLFLTEAGSNEERKSVSSDSPE